MDAMGIVLLFVFMTSSNRPFPNLRKLESPFTSTGRIVRILGCPWYSVNGLLYPNLLDPTNFSGPNANPGFPRDVGETPGFFRKIAGLEEKPGFFPIC